MIDWVFWAFVGAALIHIAEEYKYPGGFLDSMRNFNPTLAQLVTVNFAAVINVLFVLLCVAAAISGSGTPIFGLSVASLLFVNALTHATATVMRKRYAPGVVSGVLLYLPLSVYAYYLFASAGRIDLVEGLISGLLGAAYQSVPIGYLIVSSILRSSACSPD